MNDGGTPSNDGPDTVKPLQGQRVVFVSRDPVPGPDDFLSRLARDHARPEPVTSRVVTIGSPEWKAHRKRMEQGLRALGRWREQYGDIAEFARVVAAIGAFETQKERA